MSQVQAFGTLMLVETGSVRGGPLAIVATEWERGGLTDALLMANRLNHGRAPSLAILRNRVGSNPIYGIDPGSRVPIVCLVTGL